MRINPFSLSFPLLALLIALAACSADPAPAASRSSGQDALQQTGPGGLADPATTLNGVVRELHDDRLVLERMDGTSVTITLSAETAIRQQAMASAADLVVGAQVVVLAEDRAGKPGATLVQIGGAAGPLVALSGEAGGPGGAPATLPLGSDGPAAGDSRPQLYMGTVQAVGEGSVTLQQSTGELIEIGLHPQTRYQHEVSADRAALQEGVLAFVEGSRDGTTFHAMTIRLASGG